MYNKSYKVFYKIIALFFLFPLSAGSKDLGIHGQVFEIAEKDLLEEIHQKLSRFQKDGMLEEIQKQHARQARQSVDRPKTVEGLARALKSRTWLHDPSLLIPKDIKDHKGRLIARAGTVINPLDTVRFARPFVFINSDDAEQLAWLKDSFSLKEASLKVILTQGRPLKLAESLKMPVYFDQGGKLVQHFGIKALPAVVRQEGKKLRVAEITIPWKEE